MSDSAELATVIGDGDVTSLSDVLGALAVIEDEYDRIRDARSALRKTAAAMMHSSKVKSPIVSVGRLTYVGRIERDTKTVCACHKQAPYFCKDRLQRPIALVETSGDLIAKLTLVLPATQRSNGDAAA